jgi:hypothetical protein
MFIPVSMKKDSQHGDSVGIVNWQKFRPLTHKAATFESVRPKESATDSYLNMRKVAEKIV